MVKTITFFLQSGGMKGRTVIERFVEKPYYKDRYDAYAVLDSKSGDAVDKMGELNIPYTIAGSRKNPQDDLELLESTRNYTTDFLVSCGWVHKIPVETINHAQIGAINCHSSYLPDYKGLCAYRALWANAADEGGATVHYLTEEFDEGNIVCQERFPIGLFDTPLDIARAYCDLTAVLLREALHLVENGYDGEPHSGGRYFPKLSWPQTIRYGIENHLRRAVGISTNEVGSVQDDRF